MASQGALGVERGLEQPGGVHISKISNYIARRVEERFERNIV
jgi:hypothetical protein